MRTGPGAGLLVGIAVTALARAAAPAHHTTHGEFLRVGLIIIFIISFIGYCRRRIAADDTTLGEFLRAGRRGGCCK